MPSTSQSTQDLANAQNSGNEATESDSEKLTEEVKSGTLIGASNFEATTAGAASSR